MEEKTKVKEAKVTEQPVVETVVVEEKPKLKLNLGCGFRKFAGYVNIDIRKSMEPDLVADLEEGLPQYATSSVDEVRAVDILEHIHREKVIFVLSEIHRVLKPEGLFHFLVPSTDGRGAFQDPFHVSFWNINSWLYFCDPDWHVLYPEIPLFKILPGGINDVGNNKYMIIHTEGYIGPVK